MDFDTVIVDLDDTIWSGSEPDLWAKKLTPPCRLFDLRLYDSVGKYLWLHEGVYEVLHNLKTEKKKIGFTTVGGWKESPFDWQPCVVVMRHFGLLDYFEHMRAIQYRDGAKTTGFVPSGKTLFIDDNEKHLTEVKTTFPDVTVMNRNSFKSWKDLL